MITVDLKYPFAGRWLVQNSPADRVPSHGTTLFGSSYAIDFVPVDVRGRTASVGVRTLACPEPTDRFPGFGRDLQAPVDGVVVGTRDTDADHAAYRGLASVAYVLTQRRRVRGGWAMLAGNHVLIETQGMVVALCHLQQGSISVRVGDRVQVGQVLGRCGNSGNSTEPHVHLQAVDDRDIDRAEAVRITFEGTLPRNGQVISSA